MHEWPCGASAQKVWSIKEGLQEHNAEHDDSHYLTQIKQPILYSQVSCQTAITATQQR